MNDETESGIIQGLRENFQLNVAFQESVYSILSIV